MQKIIPERLQKGDKIMVIAPARGVKIIGKDVREIARERLESLGLEVVFAPNAVDENWDYMGSSSVEKRISDIHTAFADKSVKGVMTIIGGANSNQLCRIWIRADTPKSKNILRLFRYYGAGKCHSRQDRAGNLLWAAFQLARDEERLRLYV